MSHISCLIFQLPTLAIWQDPCSSPIISLSLINPYVTHLTSYLFFLLPLILPSFFSIFSFHSLWRNSRNRQPSITLTRWLTAHTHTQRNTRTHTYTYMHQSSVEYDGYERWLAPPRPLSSCTYISYHRVCWIDLVLFYPVQSYPFMLYSTLSYPIQSIPLLSYPSLF